MYKKEGKEADIISYLVQNVGWYSEPSAVH